MAEVLLGFASTVKPDEVLDLDKLVGYVQSREPSYKATHILLHMVQWNALKRKLQ